MKKDRIINELYIDTLKDISSSAVKWVTFLNTSSMNYKYIFSEQVLIYAQKPESIACASIDTWNKRLKRWVNKGSKGIALLTEKNGKTGITYVFDVSDTNSRNGKKVDIWSLDTKYENDIIESLNNKFGELVSIDDISNTIMSVTSNLLEDNLKQYIDNIIENKENSLLQEFSEDEIIAMTYQLLLYSISYSVLNRCGINAEAYIELEYFQNIRLFNNKLLLALGTATNELSKLELTEIYNTLKKIRINEIRTFAKEKSSEYNVSQVATNFTMKANEFNISNAKRIETEPKTENSYRTLKVPKMIMVEVTKRKEYMKQQKLILKDNFIDNDYITCQKNGSARSAGSLNTYLQKLSKRLNFSNITIHGLRHMYATILIEQNVALPKISSLLGHNSIHTTYNIYCGVMNDNDRILAFMNNKFNVKEEINE